MLEHRHDRAVFLDAVVVVAVLADRNQLARHAQIPGRGGHVRQIGVRLRIGHGDGLKAAVHHIADRQEKLFEDERNIDEQLFFNFDQLVFVWQLKRNRDRFVCFTQLFDDFFHDTDPLT